jgi:hypothetical protein
MSEKNALQTCKDAHKRGLVDFVGFAVHKPRVLTKAVIGSEFDTVLVPLNVLTRQALENLFLLQGVLCWNVVMKPLSAKPANSDNMSVQISLSLVFDEPETKALLGQKSKDMCCLNISHVPF